MLRGSETTRMFCSVLRMSVLSLAAALGLGDGALARQPPTLAHLAHLLPRQVPAGPPLLDLSGGTDWLNTDRPLQAADLRGRIVLLDFWTLC
jgi:hypothetical protein